MSSIAIVALGVASEDDLRGIIELARAMIHRGGSPTVTPSVITHAQYEHALVESGVNFVDAGPCPFAARHDTKEGKALSGGGSGGGGSMWMFGGRLKGGQCSNELWVLRWSSSCSMVHK